MEIRNTHVLTLDHTTVKHVLD